MRAHLYVCLPRKSTRCVKNVTVQLSSIGAKNLFGWKIRERARGAAGRRQAPGGAPGARGGVNETGYRIRQPRARLKLVGNLWSETVFWLKKSGNRESAEGVRRPPTPLALRGLDFFL